MREDVPRYVIFPYVKSSAVYKCLDDPASKGVSYLANYYRMGLSTAANGAYVTRQLSAINFPSTVIALMDGLYIAGGTRDSGNATSGYGLNTEYIIYIPRFASLLRPKRFAATLHNGEHLVCGRPRQKQQAAVFAVCRAPFRVGSDIPVQHL